MKLEAAKVGQRSSAEMNSPPLSPTRRWIRHHRQVDVHTGQRDSRQAITFGSGAVLISVPSRWNKNAGTGGSR